MVDGGFFQVTHEKSRLAKHDVLLVVIMPVLCLESLESLGWIWSFRPGLVDFETPSNRSLDFVWSLQLPKKRFELRFFFR